MKIIKIIAVMLTFCIVLSGCGNKPGTGKGKGDEAYAADGEAGRKAMRGNRTVMYKPELSKDIACVQ